MSAVLEQNPFSLKGRLYDSLTIAAPAHIGNPFAYVFANEKGRQFLQDNERAERDIIADLRDQGAQVILCDSLAACIEVLDSNPSSYALDGVRLRTPDVLERAPQVLAPKTLPYFEYSSLPVTQQFLPAVFANADLDGGMDKFLVETPEQLKRLAEFGQSGTDQQELINLPRFEMREAVPTPSDHYTSYRILTAPTGQIIGGSLLYSQHTKSNPEYDTVPESYGWTRPGDHMLDAFRNPTSPYFLRAKKITSNVNLGGKLIPLVGVGAEEAQDPISISVLEAHEIDPAHPRIPDELARRAVELGSLFGREHALVLGLDFLQHRDTGEFYFLEGNPGPGGETFRRCWDPEQAFGTYDTRVALYRAALHSIVTNLA